MKTERRTQMTQMGQIFTERYICLMGIRVLFRVLRALCGLLQIIPVFLNTKSNFVVIFEK